MAALSYTCDRTPVFQMSASLQEARVAAVIVTYVPQPEVLRQLLEALLPQVCDVFLVDNTPEDDGRVPELLTSLDDPRIHLHRLGWNQGIAIALNAGIRRAIDSGATHILLSDHDSLPSDTMVEGLLQTSDDLGSRGVEVGAVAPLFTDQHTGIAFPFQAEVEGKFFYGHLRPDASQPVVEAITLITSGMLVPAGVFVHVGLMREDLFIDHVDIEWCHRARASGYHLYGTSNATMFHRLGDSALRVWYFGWRQESEYSPLRIYYRVRNFMVLCRYAVIPWRWKVRNAWYWAGFLYSHVIFGSQRLSSLHMAFRGASDGLRGNLGPYKS
jgi:rhamnosyltransferase